MASSDPCSVKVALRVRPLVSSEISKGCKDIVEVIPENEQVVIKNSDKAFTFNYVFGQNSPQDDLYTKCVQPLLNSLYQGFNVTIFAYGQTGSGKTFTMGTTYSGEGDMGVIPRTVNDIFFYIRDNFSIDFGVSVSFTELYQEVLYDLLSNKPRDQCMLEIREDQHKEMVIPGLTEVTAETASTVLEILAKGSSGRATSATAMNAQSSRSHAIFTLKICMQSKQDCTQIKTAKLQFIDLAGSERQKKTGAVGNTFKEGVNINKGLLVLGNVISALGDEKTQNGHIRYRDSNLTRLLKDSLGGNSMTLMIACVSPADYNLDETISTLRYADRARKIKNKPIVNQDPKAAEINSLKRKIKDLQLQIIGQGGVSISSAEIDQKNREIEQCKYKIRDLSTQLSCAILEKTGLHEKNILLQSANEALNNKLQELKAQYDITFQNISVGFENNNAECIKENLLKLGELQNQFDEINTQQKEHEAEIRQYEETFSNIVHASPTNCGENHVEIHEKQESHTTRQLVLNSELQEISKKLVLKERLALQLASNTNNMVDQKELSDLEAKVAALEKERDELIQQLKNIHLQQENKKIAEQKRKALAEMEQQINNMKKQIVAQSRLIKLKEKDEQRVRELNREIYQMKQQKVKLVKQMREESNRYHQWKIQKDRELLKVKQQDQKKQTEIAKMKVQHEKQKVCLKRKVEAAEALNKRLKDQLALRKQAHDAKMSGKVERLGPWLKHELDVFLSLIEAETTLTSLLEDRGILQQQLDELKSNPETSESAETKALEEDIELRSVQISDLQQKLLDSDEDNKSKTRFDNIQSMGEAKFALKTVFDECAEIHKEKILLKTKIEESQETIKDMTTKLEEKNNIFKDIEEKYQDELSQIQKVHEEKISILLRQLRGVKTEESDSDVDHELRERCAIQEEKIESLESTIEQLEEEVRKKEQLCQNILAEVEEYKLQKRETHVFASPMSQLNGTFTKEAISDSFQGTRRVLPAISVLDEDVIPVTPDTNMIPKRKRHESAARKLNKLALDDSIDIDNDDERDPDWKKTPLGKRIEREKRLRTSVLKPSALYSEMSNVPFKRSSEGGCTCKSTCSSQRCGCKKTGRSCTASCKCSECECLNRDDTVSSTENVNPNLTDASEDSQDNDDGDTFKKPRIARKVLKNRDLTMKID